jgi:hypothetical protein
MTADILRFLKNNGEQLDAQIAQALNIPLPQLQHQIAQLSLENEIICCNLTRYVNGTKIEGTSCRLSCDTPAAARGRKPAGAKEDAEFTLSVGRISAA